MAHTYETKNQLAERLGVGIRTIQNWMSQKRIPYVKLTERMIRFVPDEVDKALLAYRVSGMRKFRE